MQVVATIYVSDYWKCLRFNWFYRRFVVPTNGAQHKPPFAQSSFCPTLNFAIKKPIVSSDDDGSNLWTSCASSSVNHCLQERLIFRVVRATFAGTHMQNKSLMGKGRYMTILHIIQTILYTEARLNIYSFNQVPPASHYISEQLIT